MVQLMPLPSHHLLRHYNTDWFNLSGAGYPGCPEKEAIVTSLFIVILNN